MRGGAAILDAPHTHKYRLLILLGAVGNLED